jgi:uncharacterized repeat protein (TIGR03843 family)
VKNKSESESISCGDDEKLLLEKLSQWTISGIGLHPGGSNYVFVVRLTDPEIGEELRSSPMEDEGSSIYAIYKPQAGERPLRDFTSGTLHIRERAAYLVSRELGWPRIPPTVIRSGPHGQGSVQLFIDAKKSQANPENYFSLREKRLHDFRDIAMFDTLIHNADRKGGSCILSPDGCLWAIDHGLTFNYSARRRTVMFEFNGSEYPLKLLKDIESLIVALGIQSRLYIELAELLGPAEIRDLIDRAKEMIHTARYPDLNPEINVPWPMI